MGIKREYLVLAAIFLIVLGIRLFFAFQAAEFSDSASYFNLRQIEHIRATGLPIYNDPLSYSGRFYMFLPLFHYLIAFFGLMMPIAVAVKIVPCLLISSLVIIVYLIAKEMTGDPEASLAAAAISGFLPILFLSTVNSVSVYSLVLPLAMGTLLALMRIRASPKSISMFMVLVALMMLTDLSIIALLFGFFIYVLLGWLIRLEQQERDLELISASSLVVIFFSFLIFKNLYISYGLEIVRQNVPQALLHQYFAGFNIFEVIYQIGIIPFLLGIIVIYKHLFVQKNRNLYIIISFALSLSLLIWLGLIELKVGLVYFSVVSAILSAEAYHLASAYIRKTKLARFYPLFMTGFVAFATITSVVPSIIYSNQRVSQAFDSEEMAAMGWFKDNTADAAVVAGSPDSGHLITALADRRNVMDTNFVMQNDADQRLEDLETIYTTRFQTEAIRLLTKYDVDYVLFSTIEADYYNVSGLSYAAEGDCFKLVYDEQVKIYRSVCKIEEE